MIIFWIWFLNQNLRHIHIQIAMTRKAHCDFENAVTFFFSFFFHNKNLNWNRICKNFIWRHPMLHIFYWLTIHFFSRETSHVSLTLISFIVCLSFSQIFLSFKTVNQNNWLSIGHWVFFLSNSKFFSILRNSESWNCTGYEGSSE